MYVDIFTTKNKYKTIYADPPWMERGGGKIKRGADKHYSLMSVEEISNLPVKNLIHEDGCHLYLWVTNNFLEDAFYVIKKWGFEYVTTITWLKDKIGLGQYYRGLTEHCLFCATKKRLPYKFDENGNIMQGVTVFLSPKSIHSKKPGEMAKMIEKVSYSPRIELFARDKRENWDCFGFDVERV